MSSDRLMIESSTPSLSEVMQLKYGPLDRMGWGPRQRSKFNYRTPDDWYETFVFDRVSAETEWLDVGCGRDIFPHNRKVAKLLSERCRLLVGIDPSDNVDDNQLVHQRAKCTLEEFQTNQKFDLITLRMVAEHIANPKSAVETLSRLAKPGGRVVIYTVWKWAPASLAAALTPMGVHHVVKKFLWRTEERDTFPVEYQMNTRAALSRLFHSAGFEEEQFYYLDDCRSFTRFPMLNRMELRTWQFLRSVGIRYPERCILATYRKTNARD